MSSLPCYSSTWCILLIISHCDLEILRPDGMCYLAVRGGHREHRQCGVQKGRESGRCRHCCIPAFKVKIAGVLPWQYLQLLRVSTYMTRLSSSSCASRHPALVKINSMHSATFNGCGLSDWRNGVGDCRHHSRKPLLVVK